MMKFHTHTYYTISHSCNLIFATKLCTANSKKCNSFITLTSMTNLIRSLNKDCELKANNVSEKVFNNIINTKHRTTPSL